MAISCRTLGGAPVTESIREQETSLSKKIMLDYLGDISIYRQEWQTFAGGLNLQLVFGGEDEELPEKPLVPKRLVKVSDFQLYRCGSPFNVHMGIASKLLAMNGHTPGPPLTDAQILERFSEGILRGDPTMAAIQGGNCLGSVPGAGCSYGAPFSPEPLLQEFKWNCISASLTILPGVETIWIPVWKELGPRRARFAGQKDSFAWRQFHAQWKDGRKFTLRQKTLTKNPQGRGRGRQRTGIVGRLKRECATKTTKKVRSANDRIKRLKERIEKQKKHHGKVVASLHFAKDKVRKTMHKKVRSLQLQKIRAERVKRFQVFNLKKRIEACRARARNRRALSRRRRRR